MKKLIAPIAIIVVLISFFVIIDRKEFSRHDNVQTVYSNPSSTNKYPTISVPEIKSEIELKPVVELKPIETKSIAETKTVESKHVAKTRTSKPAEFYPVSEAKSKGKANPTAVPIVTKEEAKKLNEEALVKYENDIKTRVKEKKRLERGFVLALSEQFEDYIQCLLTKENEAILKKSSYDLDEFRKRVIPKTWDIDYSTIPSNASFQKTAGGYNIVSPKGNLRFVGARLNGMCSSFLFELTVRNESEKESEITLGVHNSGILKNGYKTLATEIINRKEEKTIEVELSVFEQLTNIAPTISVKGAITLSGLTIYRKNHDNFSIVEGEIVERSVLPDPEDTDYPDCRYTAHFVGNAILSGMPCNKELVLSIDGFHEKKVLSTNSLKVGDKIQCAIVPIDSIPQELASIQEADDLSLFALDSYLLTTCSLITSPTDFKYNFNALVPFKSESFEFRSVFNQGFNPPIPENTRAAQKKQIEKDLAEANRMIVYLEKNREELEKKHQIAWAEEKKRYPDGFNTIKKADGNVLLYWRNIDNSFWCLPPNYVFIPSKPHELPNDKLNALSALKDFLESNGIQLIVSLIPTNITLSSRIINSEFKDIPDLQSATYVKQLSERGIECIYEVPRILANYNRFQLPFYSPSDGHPGNTINYSVAEECAERLSRFDFIHKLDRSLFSYPLKPYANKDDTKYPSNCDIGRNKEGDSFQAEVVCYDGKTNGYYDDKSEVLVLGNSYTQTPFTSPPGFPSFLSERLLYPVDYYIVSSNGPMTTIIQRLIENPESFLKGKKVVILQMGVIHCNTSAIWNNIAEMDRKRLMLNGKKLVDTLYISGNGDYAKDFDREYAKDIWEKFDGKNDIKCFDDNKFEIFRQTLQIVDPSKPFVCVVQTVRSNLFSVPSLFVNGIEEFIPSTHDSGILFWQDVYFYLPAGTSQLKIELQGQKNTLVGFNKVFIYQ